MSAKDRKEQDAEELRNYAKSPRDWPKWPRLPIMLRQEQGSLPKFGQLFEVGINHPPDIRFIDKSPFDTLTSREVLSAPKADVNKLAEEGWVVD